MSDAPDAQTAWIDWNALESRIPLDDLPAFHREFLGRVRPGEDWDAASLRKVQGRVQASLKALEREGLARRDGDRLLVARRVLPERFVAGVEGEAG